ncbi:MAG: hypothetical protein M1830_000510 [Pleopsidium flavum]|nr:MAG: hypothetical protein M1830_000510 [Pleopsidium flavum]
MDVISAVAGLTTLITFTLQSSQVIFQTANAVIDGPSQVVRFAGQVETLHRGARGQGKQAGYGEDASVFVEIKGSIQRLQAKMSKLQAAISSNSVRRVWSIVEIVLGSKDFEDMEKVVRYHVQVLNTQLSMLADLNLDHRLCEVSRNLHSSFDAVGVDLNKLKSNVIEVEHGFNQQFGRLEGSSRQLLACNTATLSVCKEHFENYRTEAKDSWNLVKKTSRTLEDTSAKLEGLSAASHNQLETITDLLRQIQLKQCPGRVESQHGITRDASPQFSRKEVDEVFDDKIFGCIHRLCSLASSKPQVIAWKEAQSIIDDLETILKLTEKRESSKIVPSNAKRKRHGAGVEWDVGVNQPCHDLKRVRRTISAAHSVALATGILPFQDQEISKNESRRRAQCHIYDAKCGSIVITYATKPGHNNSSGTDDKDRPGPEKVIEVFEGTVSLVPLKDTQKTKFCVAFYQKVTNAGLCVLNPSLSFPSMVPFNSEIFYIVKVGDVHKLKELLNEGAASLTDCDPEGRSLPHVRLLPQLQSVFQQVYETLEELMNYPVRPVELATKDLQVLARPRPRQ